ncbi:MAG: PBP1A family penicillin-binding protein [Desulfobacterota bacterium]|nr:PBP1A family penicillin-binding protein [Thermodesulfobacteriota bacterium]
MDKGKKKIKPRRKKKTQKGLVYSLLLAFATSAFLLLLLGISLFVYYSRNLPDFASLKERDLEAYSIVYSEDDEVVGKFLLNNRIPISYEKIPKPVIQAFLAAEDAEFFEHRGIDYRGILRALLKNILAGKIVQGGSTITQQVTKTFFLTPQRSLLRKLKEVAYAFGLERNFTKEEILTLYLNHIYLGNGAYGIEAAAESYFNKRVEQLNLAEIAMLAGLAKAPSRYSPVHNLSRAKERQHYVLSRMAELGFITPDQKEKALRSPLKVQSRGSAFFSRAPYFTELIRQQIERKYGKEKLYKEGLRIYTGLDLNLQKAAERAIDMGLRDLDKRQGFRGPVQRLTPEELKEITKKKRPPLQPLSTQEIYEGVVLSREDSQKHYLIWVADRKGILPYSEMAWALQVKPTPHFKPGPIRSPADLFKPGDVVQVRLKEPPRKETPPVFTLEQEPLVQGALICIDPRTGFVKALVGGRDFLESQFNRAVHSRRQPGSAFKPLIYAAALEKGYTPSTILMDSPVEYSDYDGGYYWAPKNYDKNFMGPITFRNALAHSRNVVTVKILEDIGIGYALKFFKKLGIESPIKRDLSVALGTSGVSLLELVSAYAVFANGGERIQPLFIKKVVTMKGEVLEEHIPFEGYEEVEEDEEEAEEPSPKPSPTPVREQVISPQHAFIMTHLLEGVIQHGTGQRAKILGRPVAGKTGTSSDYADAWFIGYTPSLLAGVWVGFDDKTSLGRNETGAKAALPIWIAFMGWALDRTPPEPFRVPEKIVLVRVNLETGLPADGSVSQTVLEAFVEGTVPKERGDLTGAAPFRGVSLSDPSRPPTTGP